MKTPRKILMTVNSDVLGADGYTYKIAKMSIGTLSADATDMADFVDYVNSFSCVISAFPPLSGQS